MQTLGDGSNIGSRPVRALDGTASFCKAADANCMCILQGNGFSQPDLMAARQCPVVDELCGVVQVCLPSIWALSFLLVTYRLGVLPAESAASLKLLDKGVAKEALAALVLVQFPVELVSAVVAGRCAHGRPLRVWLWLSMAARTSLHAERAIPGIVTWPYVHSMKAVFMKAVLRLFELTPFCTVHACLQVGQHTQSLSAFHGRILCAAGYGCAADHPCKGLPSRWVG